MPGPWLAMPHTKDSIDPAASSLCRVQSSTSRGVLTREGVETLLGSKLLARRYMSDSERRLCRKDTAMARCKRLKGESF